MIIDINDIRAVRQIAGNVDEERVNIYIREAELLDLEPVIGADLYEKLTNIGTIVLDDAQTQLQDEDGGDTYIEAEGDLPNNEFKLLNGGYYKDECGVRHRFEGIKKALAYFSYARFVRNHSTQVTPFGIVNKLGDDSNPADARSIAAISADAHRIAEDYLAHAMKFWHCVERARANAAHGSNPRKKRFVAIGD